MIYESYCSYEISKLLKEKGFDEPCRSYFISDSDEYRKCTVDITSKNCISGQILRPTHQMACAWLREKGIEIDAYLSHITEEFGKKTKHYVFSIVDLNTDKDYPEYSEDYHYYPTYEEAVEAALKYSLENLI